MKLIMKAAGSPPPLPAGYPIEPPLLLNGIQRLYQTYTDARMLLLLAGYKHVYSEQLDAVARDDAAEPQETALDSVQQGRGAQ